MAGKQRPKMVPGYNHNVRHKGRIYHVQTEDSGIDNPHIITHLFLGGNILATKKTSYADIVNAENLEEIVRELMQEQHKAMLRNLVNGVYDDIEIPGETPTPQNYQTGITEQRPVETTPNQLAASQQPFAVSQTLPFQTPPATPPAPSTAPPVEPGKFPPPRPSVGVPRPIPTDRMPTQPVIHVISAQTSADTLPSPPPVQQPKISIQTQAQPQRTLPPEVIAARQLTEKPKPQKVPGPTIFGEDLISEKSLDEVILSYLAGEEKEK